MGGLVRALLSPSVSYIAVVYEFFFLRISPNLGTMMTKSAKNVILSNNQSRQDRYRKNRNRNVLQNTITPDVNNYFIHLMLLNIVSGSAEAK